MSYQLNERVNRIPLCPGARILGVGYANGGLRMWATANPNHHATKADIRVVGVIATGEHLRLVDGTPFDLDLATHVGSVVEPTGRTLHVFVAATPARHGIGG